MALPTIRIPAGNACDARPVLSAGRRGGGGHTGVPWVGGEGLPRVLCCTNPCVPHCTALCSQLEHVQIGCYCQSPCLMCCIALLSALRCTVCAGLHHAVCAAPHRTLLCTTLCYTLCCTALCCAVHATKCTRCGAAQHGARRILQGGTVLCSAAPHKQ